MKQKKVIATLTESELKRIIRNEVMRYLKEEEEVDPEAEKEVEKAFTDAAAKLSAELSSIGKNVEAKEKDDAAVDAALKKQPELAKVAQEAVRRRGKALNEGKRRQAINEEITVLFIASVALALPAIMELVGKIVKTISLFLGGSGKAGEKLIHAGHKWHGKIIALILKGLTFIPGFKSLPADKQQKVANLDSHDSEQQGNSSSGEQTGETEESENDRQEPSQSKQPEESSGNSSGNQTIPDLSSQEPEVRTADALREKIESLVSSDNRDNVYVELPHLNLETIIAKNSEIHQYIDENFERQKKYIDANNDTIHNLNLYEESDKSYKQFKTSAQKEVNYLVKEFECRKAADSYARTSTARTGVLDTTRLHTYKYNEDLFKKMSVIPDGKNHGLIFILDWSGSMNEVIQDTCKQLFNLIWFCKKVSIPFEVYAFTNEWRSPSKSQEVYSPHYEKREGLIYVADDFSLLNLLTSKVNMKTLEHQMLNIWRLTIALRNPYGCGCRYVAPTRLYLSSTPLNEALIALHQILPNFQRENKLQKVQCVVLTDGEANCLPYHIEVKRGSEPYIGVRGISPEQTFLRDRKIGTTYKFGYEYHKFTEVLISNLKDKFPTVNMIGIRVLQNRDTSNFVSLYYNKLSPQYVKILSDWKKNRSLNILESSYDAYFGLSASTLSQDSEFEVAEDATKSQIKSAFVKSLKIKKLNKKVLGQFMELVV